MQRESTVDTRRRRLREWIDTRCNKLQSEFLGICAENDYHLSQSELSGLLRTKSFGEKKARAIEIGAGMPAGHLDVASDKPDDAPGSTVAPIIPTWIARQSPPDSRWTWPFKDVTPDQYKLLSPAQKKHVEDGILFIVNAREPPEKYETPAQYVTGA